MHSNPSQLPAPLKGTYPRSPTHLKTKTVMTTKHLPMHRMTAFIQPHPSIRLTMLKQILLPNSPIFNSIQQKVIVLRHRALLGVIPIPISAPCKGIFYYNFFMLQINLVVKDSM